MKIFFAGSIRGGRQMISTYGDIINFLKSRNVTVISEHVGLKDIENIEASMSEQEIFEKDMNWIKEADCVIAEVTIPSTGVGYEICHAVRHQKPVLCMYKRGARPSAMILGNMSEYITVEMYSTTAELEELLMDFLKKENEKKM